MSNTIYLDANATCPVLPASASAALHAMSECYGNPSSTHGTGLRARAILDRARQRARRLLGVADGRLMFNSGATEGIQTAVLSALCALRDRRAAGEATGSLLLYGATEHKAVSESLAHWNRILGLHLTLRAVPVDRHGRHDLDALRALAPDAAMVCTMAANNETGTISDLDGIEAALRGGSAYWMVDCVQALGKLDLALERIRIDYAPFSGHKLYAPKGIGMLYVRDGAPYTPLIVGGGQEGAQRSGTENIAGIAALDAVLEALESGGVFRSRGELTAYRDRIAGSVREAFPDVVFNTAFEHALPTTLNFSVPGTSSRRLMDVFDAAEVSVSAGSACASAKAAPSYVLEAMGMPAWRAANAVRMSFGALVTDDEIERACERIRRCGAALRERLADTPPPSASSAVPPAAVTDTEGLHLDLAAIASLLDAHPNARLIDVRERCEHDVSPRKALAGRALANVPLDHLKHHVGEWLQGDGSPLIFVCRSGNRSARAAACLRRHGYRQAYDLAGGLALCA